MSSGKYRGHCRQALYDEVGARASFHGSRRTQEVRKWKWYINISSEGFF